MKDEILKIANEVLTEDEVNEIVKEKFKKAVSEACDDAFKWGDIKSAIRDKINTVMVPYIASRDFSEFLPMLDTVLSEIVNTTNLTENKEILENFKELMIEDEELKTITTSELFKKWCEYVAEEVETSGLDIDYDDGVSYETVEVTMEVEEQDRRSWSYWSEANIIFECEHDENMNIIIPISKWNRYDKDNWSIRFSRITDINSLRYIKKFEMFLLKLQRNGTKIIIDEYSMYEDVRPIAEPEASYS